MHPCLRVWWNGSELWVMNLFSDVGGFDDI